MGRPVALPTITDDSALGGTVIEKSVRFHDADGAHFRRDASSTGNRRTWTFSCWVKRMDLGAYRSMFGAEESGTTNTDYFLWWTDDTLCFTNYNSSDYKVRTAVKYRDSNSWYHLVLAVDSTQGTASNRVKMYVNGSQVTYFADVAYPSQNYDFQVNRNVRHRIGFNGYNYMDGYMANIHHVDGQQLDASAFGYTDDQTGIWRPKAFTGAYGTNGFELKFEDDSGVTATTLGRDSSGNGNNLTPLNLSVTAGTADDVFTDSPTKSNKTAHFNRNLNFSADTEMREGGYRFVQGSAAQRQTRSNLSVNSGKWYAEFTIYFTVRSGSYPYIGVGPNNNFHQSWVGDRNVAWNSAGVIYRSGNTFSSGNPTYANSDTISVAMNLDLATPQVWWAKNGSYIVSGNPATDTNGVNIPTSYTGYYDFIVSLFSQAGGIWDANFGQRAFAHTPPTGYQPLQKEKIILTPSITRAKKHFGVVTWTSDTRSSDRTIPLEFRPAFVWTKCYSGNDYHNALFNTNTGPNACLNTDENFAENHTNGGRLREFDSKGFTWRYGAGSSNQWWNEGSYKYVAWCWKGGEPDVPISGSVYFDGSSDYMSLGMDGSSADLGMGTGDFTVECWVKKDRQEHRGIWQISGTVGGLQSTNYKDTIALGYQSGVWQTYGGSGAGDDHESSSYPIEPDRWYHTAVIRSSGTTKLFIDGQQVISYADTKDYGSARYMAVGGYYNTSYLHRGSISNLNVVKGTALYTSNFTPPTEPLTAHANTKFLLCQSNNAPGDSTLHKGAATNVYNRTQWSHYLTGGGGFQGSYPASNAFNGTTTGANTSRSTDSQTTQTFTPPGGISYSSSVEVWTWMNGSVSLNGGSNITVSNDQSFRQIATGSGTINSIAFNSASGNSVYIAGIRVDGNILIEPQGVTINDNTRAENCNPFEAFSVDGVGYPTAALAGLTGGNTAISRATVNTKAGFSLITRKGNGAGSATFPHGLGVTPNIVFYKNREAQANWGFTGNIGELVYGSNKMFIQLANAMTNDTNETLAGTNATVIEVGNSSAANPNNQSTNYYCFAEKPGFSKFGTYFGDGSDDAAFVWCGFRPALIVVKNISADSNWRVHDNVRHGGDSYSGNGFAAHHLEWSTAAQQYSNYDLDFLGNGFKIRTNSTYVNNSSYKYFFMAFAEQVGTTLFETEANAG